MDHKWGRNVSDYGLGDVGATLAARVLVTPWLVVTNAPRSDGTQDWWFVPSADTPDTAYFQEPFTPSAVGHFPYGVLVEMDGPL